jgi:teichuronic acid biosynthesis glycosyltransferase TuaC
MPAQSSTLTPVPRVEALRALMVTNMYPTPAAPDDGTPVADELASLRARGHEVDLLHLQREGGGRHVYLGLGRRARRLVAANQPDLVLVMYGGVMADLVTRSVRDVPVLVTFRGTDLLGGKGKNALHGVSRRYGVVASRRAAQRAAGIVVKSGNLLDALPRGVDRTRAWIVPDGVDFERFRPLDRDACRAQLGWDPARRHVLFPGSSTRPEKRFDLAEASVGLLRTAGVGVELHALDGVPHDTVPTWLNAADVVLLTSVHEGSPNVVKEALACNVAVVSVDVGDVRDRIEGLDGCHIVEPDAHDISTQLGRALARGERVAGREQVADLSLSRVAERLSEIYTEVVGDAKAWRESRTV